MDIGNVWKKRHTITRGMINIHGIENFNRIPLDSMSDNWRVGLTPTGLKNYRYYHEIMNKLFRAYPEAKEFVKKYPADRIGGRATYRGTSIFYLFAIHKLCIFKRCIPLKKFILCDIKY